MHEGVILLHPIHPLQAIFLAGALTLYCGVFFSDVAYSQTFEVQWKNFASWLLVGGLAMSLVALVWALVDFGRLRNDRGARRVAYLVLLLATWILGFVNALVHAGDAWASMPMGLALAAIVALLSIVAAWLAFPNYHDRAVT